MKLPAPGAVARSLSAREFRATIRPLRTVRQKPAESFPSILILARQEERERERESWLSAENFSLQFCKKNGANLAASLIVPREQAIVLHCCTIFFSFFAVVYLFSEIHS